MSTPRFTIYVNNGNTTPPQGYLAEVGGLTSFKARAVAFSTLDEAKREIALRGWKDDTSCRPGVTTAYVVEVY